MPKTARSKKPTATQAKAKPSRRQRQPIPKLTKAAMVRAMLQRPEGASVAEIVEATGWQSHTVRAFLVRGCGRPDRPGPKVMRGEDGRYRQAAVV